MFMFANFLYPNFKKVRHKQNLLSVFSLGLRSLQLRVDQLMAQLGSLLVSQRKRIRVERVWILAWSYVIYLESSFLRLSRIIFFNLLVIFEMILVDSAFLNICSLFSLCFNYIIWASRSNGINLTIGHPDVTEMAQMVCGSCRRLLSYPRAAKNVKCSCCQTVNLVLEGWFSHFLFWILNKRIFAASLNFVNEFGFMHFDCFNHAKSKILLLIVSYSPCVIIKKKNFWEERILFFIEWLYRHQLFLVSHTGCCCNILTRD